MLIDLALVALLGIALFWLHRDDEANFAERLRVLFASTFEFFAAARHSRFGALFLLLLIIALLRWGLQISLNGWSTLDPAAITELREQDDCHRFQRKLREQGVERFVPSERVCPIGAGALEVENDGGIRCGVHGVAP